METSAMPAPAVEIEREAGKFIWLEGNFPTWIVLLLMVCAAAVRLHALDGRGFWLDEAISVSLARNRFSALFQLVRDRELYMAFYYFLLHFWMVFGDSEFVARLPSVIFSVATVPFTYALGARLFGRAPGLIATALLTVNAFHIRFAQEARSYALAILLAVIACWLLVRNLQEPEKASWTLYGVLLALMVYSHLYSVLIVAAHVAALACLPPGRIPWKGLAKSTTWFILLVLPLAVAAARLVGKAYPLDWAISTGLSNARGFFEVTAGNGGLPLVALDGIAMAALIITAGRLWIRTPRSAEAWPGTMALLWFFLPVCTALVIAEFWPPFVPRYLLPCLPAFLLCVAAGLAALPRRAAWALGAAIFVLSSAAFPSSYHLGGGLEDWRGITSGILTRAEPGDAITFYPRYSRTPFEYYRGRISPLPVWPKETVAWSDNETKGFVAPSAPGETLNAAAMAGGRFWVVFHHPVPLTLDARKELRTHLDSWRSKGWTLLRVQEYPMVMVLLFAPASPGAASPEQLPQLFPLSNGAQAQQR